MITSSQWADAYLNQARSDISAAYVLLSEPQAFCLMLQMTFEKLAKAVLLKADVRSYQEVRTTHVAVVTSIRAIRRQKKSLDKFADMPESKWNELMDLICELERANPSVSTNGPHLEYPWEDKSAGKHRIAMPATDLPVLQKVTQRGDPMLLLRLADNIAREFDSIFY